MSLWDEFRPRHPVVAARLCLGFTAAAATVQLVQTATTPLNGGLAGFTLSYGVPLALIAAVLIALPRAARVPPSVWGLVPLAGLLAIVALDLTSHDSSVLAQVFLLFPVLFASSQLRPRGALAMTVVAALGEAAVVFTIDPLPDAIAQTAVMATAMFTACLLLLHSNAEQDRLVARLAQQARVDALTGVFTRRPLDELAQQALDAADDRRRPPGLVAHPGTAMLLVDLDLFKAVNDTYGHPVGDDFLVHAAGYLAAHCRPQDVVGRLGGDEFAVLLRECRADDALARAQELLAGAGSAPLVLADGTAVPLRFTIGVGHVPAGVAGTVRELYARADAALYRAKQAGRGRVAADAGSETATTADEDAQASR